MNCQQQCNLRNYGALHYNTVFTFREECIIASVRLFLTFLSVKNRLSALDLVFFVCWMTIVNPNKNLLPKLDDNRATRAKFIEFGNNCSTSKIYWFHKQPRQYYHSYHNKLNILTTLSILQEQFASPLLPSLS
jgi:hypothetical protein